MTVQVHQWGDGAPLIALHGWTMTGALWADLAPLLPAQVLAPDLPGHGATTGFAASVAGGVDLLADLIARRNLAGVTLVGWSLGALIGWQYLAQGGAGIARMVSIDMSPCPLPAPGWPHAMRGQSAARASRSAQRFRQDWSASSRAIAQGLFAAPEGCAALPLAAAEALVRANDPRMMTDFWTSLTRTDLRAAIPALPVPLLAIHGAKSRVYAPQTAEWLARTAPQGRARVIAGAGHAPHLEMPRMVARAIIEFAAP